MAGQGVDELDLFEVLTLLWKKKRWIFVGGIVASMLGLVVYYTATPVYHAESIISPKETNQGNSSSAAVLAQIGGLGSGVAAQLGDDNAPLERLSLLLESRDLAASVIQAGNLLPKLYPKQWDPKRQVWRDGRVPSLKSAALYLKSSILTVQAEPKKSSLTIEVSTYDSTLADQVVDLYLTCLKSSILQSVRADADSNRAYLEGQLEATSDPEIKVQILQLIGNEIEKGMLVNSRSFDVIESPVVPWYRTWPRRGPILMVSFLLGLMVTSLGILTNRGIQKFRETSQRSN